MKFYIKHRGRARLKIFVKYGGRAFLDLRWIYICSICPPRFSHQLCADFFKKWKLPLLIITRYLFHVFTLKTHNLDTFCCWLKFWPPKDFGKTNHLPKRIWIQNTKKTKLSNWQKLQIYSAYFKLVKICVVLKHVLMTVLSACLLCVAFGKLFVKLAQWENPKHALMGDFSYIS